MAAVIITFKISFGSNFKLTPPARLGYKISLNLELIMNTLNWGRKRAACSHEVGTGFQDNFRKLLFFGISVCLLFTLTLTNDPSEYIPTFAQIDFTENHNESTASDPFGYFNGKWNLWEYLGDAMASILE